MKQNIEIKTKAQSQNQQVIKDATGGSNLTMNGVQSNFSKYKPSFILPALMEGRGSQHLGRDGPPGLARSPGINSREELHLLPSPLFNRTMIINILINTKIQSFITI